MLRYSVAVFVLMVALLERLHCVVSGLSIGVHVLGLRRKSA
jgi:hypothetical protein